MKRKPKYICELPDEKRLELCEEAWNKLNYFEDHGYKHRKDKKVGPDTVYTVLYRNDTECCKDRKEMITSGFECPSDPPYYLRQGDQYELVHVMVVTNEQ